MVQSLEVAGYQAVYVGAQQGDGRGTQISPIMKVETRYSIVLWLAKEYIAHPMYKKEPSEIYGKVSFLL